MIPIVFVIVALVTGMFVMHSRNKRTQRKKLLQSALTDEERRIVGTQAPLVRRLPQDLQSKLEGKISLFLEQVDFVGCDGLEITKEMQLSIAAQACILVVNTEAWYDTLRTILVYPGAFKSKNSIQNGYVTAETEIVRLGESWARGPVILSWAHTVEGAENDTDGQNVVLHEFAHQLDNLSGQTNGVPVLSKRQSFGDWERVILNAYERHLQNVQTSRQTVLLAYGAENHQEFFAVAIEAFLENPMALKEDEPEFYAQLSTLLDLDPCTWKWS